MTTGTRHYAHDIPPLVLRGIIDYVEGGWPTGNFLKAVLEDRPFDAVMRADEDSLAAIKQILWVLYGEAPDRCWGSPKKVAAWLELDEDARKKDVDGCATWHVFITTIASPETD